MFARHVGPLAALVLTALLCLAGSARAGGHDAPGAQGQGQQKKEENSAQPQPPGQAQTSPGSAGRGAEKREARDDRSARADKPDKPARADRPARAAKPDKGKPAGERSGRRAASNRSGRSAPADTQRAPQSTAGKTTICHATGSATNPYVTITVSNNALKAHSAHQDGRDIIPAPPEGCPGGSAPDRTMAGQPGERAKKGKTTICHATGSDTNPYVVITISDSALEAHRAHQDGRDIIPAPPEGCPGAPTIGMTGLEPGVNPLSLGDNPLRPGIGAAAAKPGGVLGAFSQGGPDEQGGTAGRESGADAPSASRRLPFTGLGLGLLVTLALGAIVAGLALRRSVRGGAA